MPTVNASGTRNFAVLIAMLGCLLCRQTIAAPAINAAEDDPSDDNVIVVHGSGFGQKSQPAPIFFDTVDTVWQRGSPSTPYASLSSGASVPAGGNRPWQRNTADMLTVYRQGSSYGERQSRYRAVIGKNEWGKYQSAWLEMPTTWSSAGGNTLYVRWYFKPSFDPENQSGSHKFIRVWDTTGSNPSVRISWTQMHLTYDGSGSPDWSSWGGNVNQWNLMELYIDTSSRRIRAWVNGRLVHDINDFAPGNHGGLQPRLWGIDGSGDANFSGQTVELADYYSDTTQARVEICDRSTWSNCTVREPQLPTQWSSSRVEFRINRGALGNLQDKYVYVIAADGSVNQNGYPLANVAPGGGGGGSTTCNDCPPQPPQLSVLN
jgi:hypothetical protein